MTWTPWQPTRVKKADRKALRLGPAPCVDHADELADLDEQEARPEHERQRHAAVVHQRRRALAPMVAMPQVKLESKRKAVSIATLVRLKRSFPLGPPAVSPDSTA